MTPKVGQQQFCLNWHRQLLSSDNISIASEFLLLNPK